MLFFCISAPTRQTQEDSTDNEGDFIYRSLLATHRRQALALCFAVTTNNGKNIVYFVAHSNIIYYIYNICSIGIFFLLLISFCFFEKSLDFSFFLFYYVLTKYIGGAYV